MKYLTITTLLILAGCGGPAKKAEPIKTTTAAATTEQEWRFIDRPSIVPTDQTCREYLAANPPNYTDHPLYGSLDVPALRTQIEKSTGRPWVITFAERWLCCIGGDPVENLDVNFDGITDFEDFAILTGEQK